MKIDTLGYHRASELHAICLAEELAAHFTRDAAARFNPLIQFVAFCTANAMPKLATSALPSCRRMFSGLMPR